MIKVKINKSKRIFIEADGTAHDLMIETAAIIGLVYSAIRKKNKESAETFKNNLIGVLLDPETPVWKL